MKTMQKLFVLLLLATSFGCQSMRKIAGKDYMTGSIPKMGQVVVVIGVWENETNAGPMEYTVAWRPYILEDGATIQTFQGYDHRPYLEHDKADLLRGKPAIATKYEGGLRLMPL